MDWKDAWYKISTKDIYDFVPGKTEYWNIVNLRDPDLGKRLIQLIPRPQ